MSYVSIAHTLQVIRRNNAKYWRMYNTNATEVIDESQDETLSLDDSCTLLEDTLQGVTGTYVIVKASAKSGTEKRQGGNVKLFTFKIDLKNNAGSVARFDPAGRSGGLQDLYREISDLKAELVRKETQNQIESFRRELQDMKDYREMSPLDKLIESYVDKMIQSGQLAGVSQEKNNSTQTNPVTDEKTKEKLMNAIKTLGKNDPDLAETLHKIAHIAATDSKKYDNYKSML